MVRRAGGRPDARAAARRAARCRRRRPARRPGAANACARRSTATSRPYPGGRARRPTSGCSRPQVQATMGPATAMSGSTGRGRPSRRPTPRPRRRPRRPRRRRTRPRRGSPADPSAAAPRPAPTPPRGHPPRGPSTLPGTEVGKVRATQNPTRPGSATTRPPVGQRGGEGPCSLRGRRGRGGRTRTAARRRPPAPCTAQAARGCPTANAVPSRPRRGPRGAMSTTSARPSQGRLVTSSGSSPLVTRTSTSPSPASSKSRACRPAVPKWAGSSHTKTPLAPQVFTTPVPTARAKCWSPSTAPARTTPGPTRIPSAGQ